MNNSPLTIHHSPTFTVWKLELGQWLPIRVEIASRDDAELVARVTRRLSGCNTVVLPEDQNPNLSASLRPSRLCV